MMAAYKRGAPEKRARTGRACKFSAYWKKMAGRRGSRLEEAVEAIGGEAGTSGNASGGLRRDARHLPVRQSLYWPLRPAVTTITCCPPCRKGETRRPT